MLDYILTRSIFKHPTKSNQALNQSRQEHAGKQGEPERRDQVLRFQDHRNSVQRPQVDTQIQQAKPQPTAQTPAKMSIFQAPPVKDLDPAADRLAEDLSPLPAEDFYELMGLRAPTSAEDRMRKLAYKNGLYSRMTTALNWTHRKYRAFAILVYVFLVLQLIISAVFIVLGALGNANTHIAIAVLGAIATVIAGGLALMQGQGLPNRLRVSRDNLSRVVFEAEELFWDVRSGRSVLYKDVKRLREDYLRVLEEQKRNHPDTWNSVSNTLAQGSGKGGGKKVG